MDLPRTGPFAISFCCLVSALVSQACLPCVCIPFLICGLYALAVLYQVCHSMSVGLAFAHHRHMQHNSLSAACKAAAGRALDVAVRGALV